MNKAADWNSQTLLESDVLCMMPWVSLHVAMNGNAYPCCFAAGDQPIGSVRGESVTEIWNGPRARELRASMLAGRKSPVCAKCYEQEASGFSSLRTSANANYRHHWDIVRETSDDGTVRLNIVYIDVRFSNVCNFACRTCGPIASTRWSKYVPIEGGPLLRPRPSADTLLQEIEPLLGQLEQAYFAGGEPMLTREHYTVLEMLLAHGRDDVQLSYTTNFSGFTFKHWDVLELWRSFKRVDVGASLDGSHARGEYIRKGQRWDAVIENRRRQREKCPHVVFNVSSTLSILNCLHLPDCHEELAQVGFIEPDQTFVNIVQDPVHFRLTTLPPALKEQVKARYERHLAYLADNRNCAPAMRGWESAIRFMYSEDTSHHLGRLAEILAEQDRARGESFPETFPELQQLFAAV